MGNKLSDNLIIRHARKEDADAIIANINAVCAEEIYLRTEHFVSDAKWIEVLDRPEITTDHLLLIAELDGQIIGMVNVFPGSSETKDTHTADLGIHVLAQYRDQGIGTQLLGKALEWAHDRKIDKITLSVFSTNTRAIHLYGKFGFQQEGVRRKQYCVRGKYVDDILMAKFF